MEAEEDEIDHFYQQLQNVLEAVRKHDMLKMSWKLLESMICSSYVVI